MLAMKMVQLQLLPLKVTAKIRLRPAVQCAASQCQADSSQSSSCRPTVQMY